MKLEPFVYRQPVDQPPHDWTSGTDRPPRRSKPKYRPKKRSRRYEQTVTYLDRAQREGAFKANQTGLSRGQRKRLLKKARASVRVVNADGSNVLMSMGAAAFHAKAIPGLVSIRKPDQGLVTLGQVVQAVADVTGVDPALSGSPPFDLTVDPLTDPLQAAIQAITIAHLEKGVAAGTEPGVSLFVREALQNAVRALTVDNIDAIVEQITPKE